VTLGRTDDARAALREAIDRLPPTFVRERAIYTTAIAASYVPDGEIEHAATLAGERSASRPIRARRERSAMLQTCATSSNRLRSRLCKPLTSSFARSG
jgi:hypothetical protein